ncbi:MAG: hypothetical protein HOV73_25150 [Streptomyces sp.]|uniref:hypothetical protein n=1 Tax=Streptomyces sp. NPDC051913 TaxID=3365676 RepID=UPI00183EF812|nr:hypothetical protein [Streptomyces sp.]NUR43371.1 hypothetical protein [Streptomyces sp.]NUR67006.1 hypothetical protein [Streptomyces sp.]NUS77451.1 hypothetical protein [Streptomyces sp.]
MNTQPHTPFPADDSELAPLLTAWDQAHPAAADPEWRHLLDELAHPHTIEAFHRLAGAAA